MSCFANCADAPLAAEAGLSAPPPAGEDPWRTFEEVMAVVEALCPEWPQRPTFPQDAKFLL